MTVTKQKLCLPNFLRPQRFNLASSFGHQARKDSQLAPRQGKGKRRTSLQGLNAPTNSSFQHWEVKPWMQPVVAASQYIKKSRLLKSLLISKLLVHLGSLCQRGDHMKQEGRKHILSRFPLAVPSLLLSHLPLLCYNCQQLLLFKNTSTVSVYSCRCRMCWREITWSETSAPGGSKQFASPMHVMVKCLLYSLTVNKSGSARFDPIASTWLIPCLWSCIPTAKISLPVATEPPDPLGEWIGSIPHNSVTRMHPPYNTELQEI